MSEEIQNIMKANIGNYKGVMLCNRPGEDMKNQVEKPFISRVNPKDQWGLLPEKNKNKTETQSNQNTQSNSLSTLNRHKQWLNIFKQQIKEKKENEDVQQELEKEKFHRVREIGIRNREVTRKMKEQYFQLKSQVMQDIENKKDKGTLNGLTKNNLDQLSKKNMEEFSKQSAKNLQIQSQNSVPAWAQTEKQLQQKEEEECDDLLDFIDNLDYEKYIDNLEVQNMLNSLKQRVEKIKYDVEEQEKLQEELKEQKNEIKRYFGEEQEEKQEKQSYVSKASRRSVQTVRSQAQQKLKEEEKQWDKSSTINKQSAGFHDRVAKKVADEILGQYSNLKQVHSNASIRKLLEQEAINCLNNNYGVQQPKVTVVKDPSIVQLNVNPSTLPYLHRNPAI